MRRFFHGSEEPTLTGCHGAWPRRPATGTPESRDAEMEDHMVHCSKAGISLAPLNRRVRFRSDFAMEMSFLARLWAGVATNLQRPVANVTPFG